VVSLSLSSYSDSGVGLAVEPDGTILALDDGFVQGLDPGSQGFDYPTVVALHPDGSRVAGFGTQGVATVSATGTPEAVAILPGGQIAIGFTQIGYAGLAVLSADGSPDAGFGSGGPMLFEFIKESGGVGTQTNLSQLDTLAVQPDGEIIAAGNVFISEALIGVDRFNLDGSLDAGFAAGGELSTDFLLPTGWSVGVYPTTLMQPDGKILVVAPNAGAGIRRYNTDGSLDTSFGDDGILVPKVEPRSTIRGAALQPDGKIILVGLEYQIVAAKSMVVRVLADGSLDPTFGVDGFAPVSSLDSSVGDSSATSVVIQPDGKIVVAIDGDVLRLNADGMPDATFGTNGVVNLRATSLALSPGGKILVTSSRGDGTTAMSRLDADGSVDPTFGTNGLFITSGYPQEVQPDGKILVTAVAPSGSVAAFDVARFNADGSVDTTFGTNGVASTQFAGVGNSEALAIAGDGSILVAGGLAAYAGQPDEIAIIRYTPAGALDRGFGVGGVALTPTGSVGLGDLDGVATTEETVTALVLSPDSRSLYLAGVTQEYQLVLAAKYNDPPAAAPGTLQFQLAAATVNRTAGTATIMVSRTGGTSGTVTVHYQTSDGTATAGDEYTATSGTLTFADGQCCASFTIPILDNHLAEGDTTVTLMLSDPTGGAILGAGATAVLTIHADDASNTGPGVLRFDSPSFVASESDQSAVIVVDRTGGSAGTVTVPYTIVGGTAGAGVDFESTSGTLTFAPGVTRQAFEVPLLHDAAVANNTAASITLGQPTGGALLSAQTSAALTILDVDAPSQAVPLASPVPVVASSGSVSVPVTRSGGLGNEVAFHYATADGTAVAGVDYTPVSGTLAFPPGVSTEWITIPITAGYALSKPASFQLDLQAPAGPNGPGSTSVETIQLQPSPPLPPSPTPPPLLILSTSPANGSTVASLPGGHIVITFNHHLAGLTDGGSALPADKAEGISLQISSPPLYPYFTAVYNALADGTSTIVVTPNFQSYIPTTGVETLTINLSFYPDTAGSYVTDPSEGTLSFTVTGQGQGQGNPIVSIFPISPRMAAPGGTVNVQVVAVDSIAEQSLIYALAPGAPPGASIDPLTGLFTWTPGADQAGATYNIGVTASVQGLPTAAASTSLTISVLSPPAVTGVSTTVLKKGRVNKGTNAIIVDFSQPMFPSAIASGLYSISMTTKVRKHGRGATKLAPVAFTASFVGANRIRLSLAKPTKQHLTLTIRGTVTAASGLTLGQDASFNL
jgi:uncharacterized delta-60 repeat protein